MYSEFKIEDILRKVREFQSTHPMAHVGGSIGLFLHGIDLKRSILKSDIDFTVDERLKEVPIEYCSSSEMTDFDYAYTANIGGESNLYIKIDIRVCPEPSFEVIEHNGYKYNVSKVRDILFWKKKYADKGYAKHKNDLIAIETGVRPIEDETLPINNVADDLPF